MSQPDEIARMRKLASAVIRRGTLASRPVAFGLPCCHPPAVKGVAGWLTYRARFVRPPATRWRGCRRLVGRLCLLYHAVGPLPRCRLFAVRRTADQVGTPALPVGLIESTSALVMLSDLETIQRKIIVELGSLEYVGGELTIGLKVAEVYNSGTIGLKVVECRADFQGLVRLFGVGSDLVYAFNRLGHRQDSRGSLWASSTPALVKNFMEQWNVDTIALSLLSVGQPIIALYVDERSTTIKTTISILVHGYSPIVIGKIIVPRGEIESPINPVNMDVSGVKSYLVRPSFLKASKYKIDAYGNDQGNVMIWVFFSLGSETDLWVRAAPRPLLDYGPGIGLARRGAISSRNRSTDYDVNLSFDWVIWARSPIPFWLPIGVVSLFLDIMAEVFLADQIFDLGFEVSAILSVIVVFTMETTISSLVPFLEMGLDVIHRCQESFLPYLEENLGSRGVEGHCWESRAVEV
ncbi:hypothetical protein BHM03_00015893 [Ensete ventricosum]|uniref:Uncharacterized protein n=1 Tax=Ensete ventricosum TaxID=4639 RepID=A0A445MEJ3_ENSVE|nr:hypothetical protein BHM03_00015893 [Ensete ventricosum]